ncbi:hypothetical protein EBI01_20330 [Marinomonas rhizomae]|uniref:Transferrin-binding protein B C-lobe/N-lobe beta barrel domain-containing protein n=1 Tax=Marinomonas rhizomae TaxID=491948 RepID=A0A366IVK6_9GAMM|nr:Slam-dependent surface lipoprotein [Marinomonas rhizomae]RBP77738.1 hypothetical protein DFP80_1271 [Marinomonas rhizomae]RNF68392.1 hypothetical protein EBI01_20330 [Marinomonas rhizomae]
MKKLQLVSAITLALSSLTLSGMANATASGQSLTGYITVGGTTSTTVDHPGTEGAPGIGVTNFYDGAMVSFSGLTNMVSASNDVYTITPAMMPASHSALGYFDFSEISGQDVFFGEWSGVDNSGLKDSTTHTVYYSGLNEDTSVPTSGSATYTVVGINNYDGTAASLLNGTLTADFGSAELTGTMYNSTVSKYINIGTATINSTASVTGTGASGTFDGTSLTGGSVSAQFYNGQADLAGLVDFTGTEYDTAFGGSQ